jgi:prepilin-type processing-associated H-X9-DG protein
MFLRTLSASTGVRVDCWYGVNGWEIDASDATGVTDTPNCYGRYPFTVVPGGVANVTQKLHHLTDFQDNANLILVYDGLNWHNQIPYFINARHGNGKTSNILLADGHCQTINVPNDIPGATASPPTLKQYVGAAPRFILTSTLNF